MFKTEKKMRMQAREAYRIPQSVQDLIPFRNAYSDGIFQWGNMYSKCWLFTDINYMAAGEDNQREMYQSYRELLKSLDSSAFTKITINNHRIDMQDFKKRLLMPMKGDECDEYREEYNSIILTKAAASNGIIQEKYITVSICKKDIEEARAWFADYEVKLSGKFSSLGSRTAALDLTDRLRILYNFYRCGEEEYFCFDPKDCIRKGHSFKDYICPDIVEKHQDCLKLGNRYARAIYLKDYANHISDELIRKLTDLNRTMMLSIDVISIPTDEAVRRVERTLLGVETNNTNWRRRQFRNSNFVSELPYDMKLQEDESRELLSDLMERDEKITISVITIVLTADTKEELDRDTESLKQAAGEKNCQLAVLNFQQADGINTTLPIGPVKILASRTLSTESLAAFIPFKVQDIQETGGVYIGENLVSHNLIMCNRTNLMNQSALLCGIPGSGKSMFAKMLMAALILNTEDEILICDPEDEYAHLVEAMGDAGSVIRICAGGTDRLNAMYMVEGYGETNPIVAKSEFILSLIARMYEGRLGSQEKSIIDRCIRDIYREADETGTGTTPTLCTLREKLLSQPEPEAREIALALELYTDGSLDIFGKQSNVSLDRRVIVFDIHELGENLKQTALLVITDTILNRVIMNWRKGKRTHIFLDEFHTMLSNSYSAQFFSSAWRQFRKRNAYLMAITQNVEYVTTTVEGRTMISNSEFIIMLSQGEDDRQRLSELLHISREQFKYITNAAPGSGLIRYGGALVPFSNHFPENTKLYRLMTTKPSDNWQSVAG